MAVNKKIKGNTLLEVLVALVLLTITMTSGTLVFQNILKSHNLYQKWEAYQRVNQLLNLSVKNQNYINENYTEGNFRIEKTSIPYQNKQNLYLVTISITNNENKLLAESKRIIIKDE